MMMGSPAMASRLAMPSNVRPVHHEQSETVQLPDGRWVNVYGQATPNAGQQLPGTSAFDTVEDAVAAASQRSNQHGQIMQAVQPSIADFISGEDIARRLMGGAPAHINAREDALLGDVPHVPVQGRMGDDRMAVLSPEQMLFLKAMGGAGTTNPQTGAPEFWGDGTGSGGGMGDHGGDVSSSGSTSNDMGSDTSGGLGDGTGSGGQGESGVPGGSTSEGFDLGGFISNKVQNAVNNPFSTAINFGMSLLGGPIGAINSISGLLGGPTIGGALTAAARGMTAQAQAPAATPAANVAAAPAARANDLVSGLSSGVGQRLLRA